MKKFRKMIAVVLAVTVALTMGMATSFAAVPTSGSVTVNPNFEGQTYTLYKLFDAKMTYNENGELQAVTYQLPSGKTEANLTYNGKSWFELDDNNNVVAKSTTGEDWAKDPDAIAWAKSFGTANATTKTAASDNDANVKWENLDWGYYFVSTTMGSFIGVDTDNPNVTIQDKNSPPSVDKEIVSTTSGVVGDDPEKSSENDGGTKEAATAQVGDTITYKVTVTAKPGAENYVVTDVMSNGLTPPAKTGVTVTGLTVDEDYTVDVDGQTITVTFTKAYLDTIDSETDIVINYSAVLNKNAVVGEAGNPNNVELTWGHDNDNNSSTDDAKVYTAKISVTKNDGNSAGLAGATFALKNASGKYYKITNGIVSWVDAVGDASKFTSDDSGALDGEFTGLPNGSYTLEETVVPEGYNPIDPDDSSLKFTIADNDYTDQNLIQSTTVINNAGTELPSTGGIGTTIFYILGALLVVGCGIILIARRRMSANN